ncbi:sulfite exporter TauE/SafE family protein [Siculibacillus lacustris]|uniref:Probable membrane transporter protein n=1 Tax=Siculibacillus lacustris TaxID=1549641 RepID=A0A4Q9VNW9_9HYPH|nr:sulfite exporter TauE/SafE family protein [Siculibacillus lacustris]TBW37150.1 sulfite exporter TauE/SafE family protein [Siculibacillus lacustris]
MLLYLPIAEWPVEMFAIFGLGAAVGFVSGMFGVGGGFLLTPLLVFAGISPAVAVATVSAQVVASSTSGALAYWRRGAIDWKLATYLLTAGMAGSGVGVWVFAALRRFGQLDLVIALCYVVFLGSVGAFMVGESLRALWSAHRGEVVPPRRPSPTGWLRTLPLQVAFPRSRLEISAVPVIALGLGIGFLGTLLGIGGGFLIVPALIYLLRVPSNLVVGTSLVQMVATMAFATFLQAAANQTVDLVLGLLLMVGGVIGAQFGAEVGRRLRGEHLRALLGLLILAVGARFAVELVVPPAEVYTISRVVGGAP